MKFKILTIFPEFFENSLKFSLLKKAQAKKLISVDIMNLRNWAKTRSVHRQIDDRPFGGGAGMVMMVEPVYKAMIDIRDNAKKVKSIIFSPKGRKYDQVLAEELATLDELILICPHYEGFDERILNFVDYEVSVGDYILTGGEIPALLVIDSVSRLIPGVLGNTKSIESESFSDLKNGFRNLEHPQYTRPETFIDKEGNKFKVPPVLLSGDHKKIEMWRKLNKHHD